MINYVKHFLIKPVKMSLDKFNASKIFLEKVGAKLPIIQAPMAGVSTVKLASVVTNSGGLGSIPMAVVDLRNGSDPIRKQYQEFKSLTNSSIVNLNFFSHSYDDMVDPSATQLQNWHSLYENAGIKDIKEQVPQLAISNVSVKQVEDKNPDKFEEFVQTIIELQPKIVSFHFGHISQNAIKKLQANGILVFVTATSVKEARHLIELGVDGLVCQGYEAGGHRGNFLQTQALDENLSTFALFKQVKKVVDELKSNIFIIPTGGIVDGQTITNYLSLGASAVQIGTSFIPTSESNANDFIKNQILQSNEIPTIMTELVSGKPARTLKTPFIEGLLSSYSGLSNKQLPGYGYAYSGFKKFLGQSKNQEYGFYLAGQNYHLINPNLDTKEVIEKLAQEAKEAGSPY